MAAEGPSQARAKAPPPGFRGIALSSLLAGLCPLIPLPLVDEWALTLVRRRALADVLRGRGVAATAIQVRILAGEDPGRRRGCLVGVIAWAGVKLVLYTIRKLFRTVFFIFTAHQAVDRTAELFTEAYLLGHAAGLGVAAPALAEGDAGARRLRAALAAAAAEVDSGALSRTVRVTLAGSWGLLRRGARRLARALRRRPRGDGERAVPVAEEAGLLGSVVDRLAEELWLQAGYRRRLEERFAAHWVAFSAAAALYNDRGPSRPPDDRDPGRPEPPGSGRP